MLECVVCVRLFQVVIKNDVPDAGCLALQKPREFVLMIVEEGERIIASGCDVANRRTGKILGRILCPFRTVRLAHFPFAEVGCEDDHRIETMNLRRGRGLLDQPGAEAPPDADFEDDARAEAADEPVQRECTDAEQSLFVVERPALPDPRELPERVEHLIALEIPLRRSLDPHGAMLSQGWSSDRPSTRFAESMDNAAWKQQNMNDQNREVPPIAHRRGDEQRHERA